MIMMTMMMMIIIIFFLLLLTKAFDFYNVINKHVFPVMFVTKAPEVSLYSDRSLFRQETMSLTV